MNTIKKIWPIAPGILFAIFPIKTFAFWDLCFPISFTFLIFALGWPNMILYTFVYSANEKLFDMKFVLIGVIVNLFATVLIGVLIDWIRQKKNLLPKKYYWKLPVLFFTILLLLFVLSYIDPTCWPNS
jgi:hypothetical protein